MDAFIRLFKGVPIETNTSTLMSTEFKDSLFCKNIMLQTIEKGFIFSPEIIKNYNKNELMQLIQIVQKEVGLSGIQMNSSFHKSWGKVRYAPINQLVIEQIVHYITTYGFEQLGIYDENTVYIPKEKLKIPELTEDIKLTVIKGYTTEELKNKLSKLLETNIAYKEQTIKDIATVTVSLRLAFTPDKIKNKEVRIMLYDYMNVVPSDPVEFLRFLIFKATGKTLIIKDKKTIEAIKKSELGIWGLSKYFNEYDIMFGIQNLATIFYRFKPLFLAFKKNKKNNTYINKIRKLAKKYHVPFEQDYLNNVTSYIKQNKLNITKLVEELKHVTVFRKIRLLQALKFRISGAEGIVYKIRNGKSYATSFNVSDLDLYYVIDIYNIVLYSIVTDVAKNVKGKKIYIPEDIEYALPSSEKQFTGDIPLGSYVNVDTNMVAGVHWENVDNNRVDLDLSLVNSTTKIGWDGDYRSSNRDILFSGDITDAPKPNGASELFYLSNTKPGVYLMYVNYFNYSKWDDLTVPFKILVAEEKDANFKKLYIVNPNDVKCVVKTDMNKKQKLLGMIYVSSNHDKRFYFIGSDIGEKVTSGWIKYSEYIQDYLKKTFTDCVLLRYVLKRAGAILVDNEEEADINLSPEQLDKNSIINLINKK